MSSDGDVPVAAPAPPLPESLLAWGTCPALYLSCSLASLRGGLPALTDPVAAVPSFTALSPPLGLDYFGVFDGHFGRAVDKHLAERLHGAVAEQVEQEMLAETPRFHRSHGDVEGWWRTVLVDEEMLVGGGVDDAAGAVGATALVALVLQEYVVLANCGVSMAVISRGGQAVQLTAEHRPNRPDEKRRVENAGGRVAESSQKVDDVLLTSRAFGSSSYKAYVIAEPEVTAVVRRPPEDEFLILATDGLWDYVTPAATCGFVAQKLRRSRITMPWVARLDGSRGSPTALARELAEHAVRAGSQDNVSAIVNLFRNFWEDARAASPTPVSEPARRTRRLNTRYSSRQWTT